jgi:hypothetical protein
MVKLVILSVAQLVTTVMFSQLEIDHVIHEPTTQNQSLLFMKFAYPNKCIPAGFAPLIM